MNKKDNYIVKCNNSEETQKVIQFVKPHLTIGIFSHWNYVVSNTDKETPSIYDSIPIRFSGYPVITFSEWEALPNEEFILPENWYIVVTEENKEDVRNWRDYPELEVGKIAGMVKYSERDTRKGHNPNRPLCIKNKDFDFGTEITYEQFKKYVLKIESFPEKFAVLNEGYEDLIKYANEYGAMPPYFITSISYFHFPEFDGCTTAGVVQKGYTLISIEEFRKHILKQDKMEEIIEYRVKPEFSKLSKVLYETFSRDAFGGYARFDTKSVLKEQYEKAGVLDIWFKPQTKKSFTLPDINGYKGEDKGDYLLYGCAKLPVAWFTAIHSSPWNRDIKSLELSSGVKINEGEMNTIRTYLKHR